MTLRLSVYRDWQRNLRFGRKSQNIIGWLLI